jgi:hypothetical protein
MNQKPHPPEVAAAFALHRAEREAEGWPLTWKKSDNPL